MAFQIHACMSVPSNIPPMSQYRAKCDRIRTRRSSWILGFDKSPPFCSFLRCRAHRKTIAAGPVIIDT